MRTKVKLNFNLSASTINSFCACPWSFQQSKILLRESISVPSVPLVVGQAFHKLLEMFYQTKSWRTYDLFQNWEKFFDIETKIQGAKGDPWLKFAKGGGFTMIKNWVAMAKKNNWLHEAYLFDDMKEGIETEFMIPYDNDRYEINVHGFMDLVIESNGKVYILDWKTGKHSEEKYRLQALIYSWAIYKQYGIIEECVRFVHPAKKQNMIVDVHVRDEDYQIVAKKVNSMFDAIDNNHFEKNVTGDCKWCKWVDCSNNSNSKLKELITNMENE